VTLVPESGRPSTAGQKAPGLFLFSWRIAQGHRHVEGRLQSSPALLCRRVRTAVGRAHNVAPRSRLSERLTALAAIFGHKEEDLMQRSLTRVVRPLYALDPGITVPRAVAMGILSEEALGQALAQKARI
jgi:hypothetical protein